MGSANKRERSGSPDGADLLRAELEAEAQTAPSASGLAPDAPAPALRDAVLDVFGDFNASAHDAGGLCETWTYTLTATR